MQTVGTSRPSHNNWFHILFNFIGPNNGEGFRIYHSGVLVANVTRYSFSSFSRIHGRIVIGRAFTAIDECCDIGQNISVKMSR